MAIRRQLRHTVRRKDSPEGREKESLQAAILKTSRRSEDTEGPRGWSVALSKTSRLPSKPKEALAGIRLLPSQTCHGKVDLQPWVVYILSGDSGSYGTRGNRYSYKHNGRRSDHHFMARVSPLSLEERVAHLLHIRQGRRPTTTQ